MIKPLQSDWITWNIPTAGKKIYWTVMELQIFSVQLQFKQSIVHAKASQLERSDMSKISIISVIRFVMTLMIKMTSRETNTLWLCLFGVHIPWALVVCVTEIQKDLIVWTRDLGYRKLKNSLKETWSFFRELPVAENFGVDSDKSVLRSVYFLELSFKVRDDFSHCSFRWCYTQIQTML